jgi:hypothetical protein
VWMSGHPALAHPAYRPAGEVVSVHFVRFPPLGRLVVLPPDGTHDGAVTSTQVCPQGPAVSRRADLASMSGFLVTDLERFWPSRRGHAFDEFCR